MVGVLVLPLAGELLRYSKQELAYESTSIISNGSRLTSQWFEAHSRHLDIMGVSVDSVEPATLFQLGRWPSGGRPPRAGEGPADIGQLGHVRRAAALCREHGVLFKRNTVVTALNVHEDLSPLVNETGAMRWKILQVLPMGGENTGAAATRGHDVAPLLVTAAQFGEYVARARAGVSDPSIIEEEDNATMQASYILVDEFGRLLDTSTGTKTPTAASVLHFRLGEQLIDAACHSQRPPGSFCKGHRVDGAVPKADAWAAIAAAFASASTRAYAALGLRSPRAATFE